MMRRHHTEHDLRARDGLGQILCRFNALRQSATAKKCFVDVSGVNRLDHFLFVSPKLELVRASARQRNGQRGAPCSSADDCNSRHENYAFLAPKRLSVPANRRAIF